MVNFSVKQNGMLKTIETIVTCYSVLICATFPWNVLDVGFLIAAMLETIILLIESFIGTRQTQ